MLSIPLEFTVTRAITPQDVAPHEETHDPVVALRRAIANLPNLTGTKEFGSELHDYDNHTISLTSNREQEADHYGISPDSDMNRAIWVGLQTDPPDVLAELKKSPWDLTLSTHRTELQKALYKAQIFIKQYKRFLADDKNNLMPEVSIETFMMQSALTEVSNELHKRHQKVNLLATADTPPDSPPDLGRSPENDALEAIIYGLHTYWGLGESATNHFRYSQHILPKDGYDANPIPTVNVVMQQLEKSKYDLTGAGGQYAMTVIQGLLAEDERYTALQEGLMVTRANRNLDMVRRILGEKGKGQNGEPLEAEALRKAVQAEYDRLKPEYDRLNGLTQLTQPELKRKERLGLELEPFTLFLSGSQASYEPDSKRRAVLLEVERLLAEKMLSVGIANPYEMPPPTIMNTSIEVDEDIKQKNEIKYRDMVKEYWSAAITQLIAPESWELTLQKTSWAENVDRIVGLGEYCFAMRHAFGNDIEDVAKGASLANPKTVSDIESGSYFSDSDIVKLAGYYRRAQAEITAQEDSKGIPAVKHTVIFDEDTFARLLRDHKESMRTREQMTR